MAKEYTRVLDFPSLGRLKREHRTSCARCQTEFKIGDEITTIIIIANRHKTRVYHKVCWEKAQQ